MLFALAMEPLAEALRSSPEFAGIRVGSSIHKLALFVDDLLLFVQHPRRSLTGVEQLLALFQQISGLKVNADKSMLYPLCMN